MKIAVSTNDGKTICGHLGKCNQFLIFETDEYGIKKKELRETPADHHSAKLLDDCQAVITQGMGRGMYEGLYNAGIIPVITMENEPEAAVRQFLSGTHTAYPGCCSCGDH